MCQYVIRSPEVSGEVTYATQSEALDAAETLGLGAYYVEAVEATQADRMLHMLRGIRNQIKELEGMIKNEHQDG